MILLSVDKEIKDRSNPQWKSVIINGKETEYLINNCGDVWSKRRGRILKPSKNRDGYLHTTIITSDRRYVVGIHRLVAQAFIPNPENKPQVNHKNGSKINNWHGNLEWLTQQENIQHAIDNGFRDGFLGVNSPKNVYPEKTIHKICQLLVEGKSQLVISKLLNVNKGVVNSIKQRKMWKHISCKYNIPLPISRENPRQVGLRSKVIELLSSGIIDKHQILSILDLPDDLRNRNYISVIKTELKSNVEGSTTIENAVTPVGNTL